MWVVRSDWSSVIKILDWTSFVKILDWTVSRVCPAAARALSVWRSGTSARYFCAASPHAAPLSVFAWSCRPTQCCHRGRGWRRECSARSSRTCRSLRLGSGLWAIRPPLPPRRRFWCLTEGDGFDVWQKAMVPTSPSPSPGFSSDGFDISTCNFSEIARIRLWNMECWWIRFGWDYPGVCQFIGTLLGHWMWAQNPRDAKEYMGMDQKRHL